MVTAPRTPRRSEWTAANLVSAMSGESAQQARDDQVDSPCIDE